MASVLAIVRKFARTRVNVLVIGESGTGKELIARAIHALSQWAMGPFVPVHLSALPEHLVESELFGHRKGSFTGAIEDRDGLLFSANGGSLFLDEVGEIPPAIQVKLLRVLEDRKVRSVGGRKEVRVDGRLISATNRMLHDPKARVGFREDLYHRIAGGIIELPPLRERREDIPPLVQHFLWEAATETGDLSGPFHLAPEALRMLCSYHWPGTVRELRSIVNRTLVFHEGEKVIQPSAVEEALGNGTYSGTEIANVGTISEGGVPLGSAEPPGVDIDPDVRADRVLYLQHKEVIRSAGSISEAARKLGIDRQTLQRWMKRWRDQGWH
jgi:two-component system response regulator PilR (NtrC family)